jgi:peptidoglycan/LPS O-acetylase OafA/YrhL
VEGAVGTEKGESGNLDLLRATAVMLVLVFHVLLFWNHEHVAGVSLRPLGLFGVLLFFVHTTLVLMYSLERQRMQLPGKPLFTPFMVRRIFRIYPLSVVVVAAILVFRIPQAHLEPGAFVSANVSPTGWLLNLLLMQNVGRAPSVLGPLWSLPFEIQMYTVLPILYLVAARASSARVVVGIWLAAAVCCAVSTLLPVSYISELTAYVPNFVPGVVAFRLARRARPIAPRWWLPFLAMLISVFVVLSNAFPARSTLVGWLACLGLGIAIPQFGERAPGLLLQSAHVVAKYSYGIYLSHYFAIWCAFVWAGGLPRPVRWGLVALLPMLLYHAVEAPLIRAGNRVARLAASRLPTVTGQDPSRRSGCAAIGKQRALRTER